MLSYEKYEKNIDTCDKYGIQNTKISKCVTYSGNLDLIQKKKCDNTPASTPPLAAAILGIKNTAAPLPDDLDFVNLWTDVDAQEAYLSIKPTSYLILGKPGLGSYTLGESFSKKMNCIHLSTRNVLLDEIENNSPTGRCLDFNMRHNKVCKFEHILAIMQVKIQSSVIQHRGYVISGFPLVSSSKTEKYLFDCLHAEESISMVDDLLYDLIWNLKRKKAKTKVENPPSHSSASSEDEKAEEEEVAEEQQPEVEPEEAEELPVEMPKYLLDICSDIVTDCKIYLTSKKTALLQQIQEVFNFSPSVIVHISSPDTDALTKKSRKYFNYMNNSTTFNYFETNLDLELRWPNKYTMIDYSKPYDTHIFNPKYNCKQPINFANNSLNQICNYKTNISPFVEEKVKDFDTKCILKVDGRSSVHQMLHYIIGKLLLMPVKPVLIPKPLYLEEPPEDLDEFWNTVKQLNTIKSGVLNFNRYASAWYIRCPVELKKRKSIQGKPKFAVSLFKHVYLLSSLESMIAFCKNPRPYLKIEYLEPTCRIIVIGTKSSGKTMIAKCLSWLFDTPIICYKTFLKDEKEKKYNTYAKNILSEIIATIEDARFVKWQNTEIERKSNLSTWFNSVFSTLKKYVSLFVKYLKFINEEEEETDEEIIMPESEINQMEFLKQKISFLPILDDLDLCKETMLDTNLLKYAPIELITETIKPLLPVLGDKDVTEAISAYIVANDLQKDIEPTTEELMNELTQNLLTNDRESLNDKEKYGKFIIDGFPSDPEFWGYLDEFKLLPDYTIVITENKEIDIELLKAYLIIDKSSKCYKERYILSSDPLVQLKQQQMNSVDNPIEEIQSLTHELLNNICSVIFGDNDGRKESIEMVTSFTEAINKFREEWDIVKLKLEENSKAVVLVEIETKSDVEVLDEVLLKLRQCYYLSCIPLEENELEDTDDEDNAPQDMLTYNDPYYLGETNLYCPVAYYDYGVLWEAKSEFCTQFQIKSYYFCKEECIDIFQRDVTKYQTVNEPFKSFPPLRICVIGSIGCGKTTLSKQLAKELGVMHIDFEEFVNSYLIPKHFKKVGRQYENSFKDMPIDDEAVMEFQADEENEKIADIIFNENEIRRMVYNYFEKGTPLLSFLVQKLLKILWSKEPYSRSGFILDGFPKLPSDVEDMTASFCVPDIVIDLQGSSEKTLERLSSKMLKRWKMQLTEAKNEVKIKFEKMRNEWFDSITKEVVIKLITDEIINNAFPATSETDINPELNVPSVHSTIIDAHPSGSANVDANLFNYYNELIQDNPEPVDESQWEKAEDVLERINARLESIFEIDDENIQTLKDILSENKIKNVSADGTKSIMKVFRTVLPKLSVLRNRNESLFEQTFIITCDIAETLLMEGFYLFSKFNRMCPVFIFENLQAISNPYNMCKRINKTFPVIHRANIYFLCSANNLVKFRKNPLKYIQSDAINSFWEYPLRVGIIGPPKSGKSDLAAKLAKRYGLLCMSRGQAIRHVLEKLDWTEAAVKMNTTLQSGECIGTELIMNAVHTVTINHRVVTNGFVLDGFPDSPAEATELVKLGLYPLIVIEINCNEDTVRKNSQNEIYYHLLKHKPPYSQPFIEYRNSKWQESCSGIKTWINDDTQNLYTICGNSSKWQCHHDAINLIEDIIRKVNYYLRNVKTKIVPAFVMGISNEIFEKRVSPFKNLCPICLRRNILRHNGFPIDKRGLVQFRNVLYWFCPDHFDLGLKHPELYLKGKVKLPEIPAPIKTISSALLYEDGVCIVTYADNLPSQKIYRGNPNFAASYHGNHYLFCSLKCLQKFLARPRLYYDVTVFKETAIFPTLSLKKLPNLGYLEQTLGNILTRACCAVNATRPKYPGLNIRVSGLLYVALYLKLHNPSIKEPVHDMYDKVYRKYEARCKLIHDIRYRLRSMENPFAKYPKRCSPRKVNTGTVSKPPSVVSMSNTVSSGSTYNRIDTSRVPVPDERFDYLCQFHKPVSKVPAFLNVVDIAGLVRGAAEGQGLGNAFLSHIKACDAIFNLCRAFDDEDVIHVDGDVNPVRDLETIGEELRLKDEEQLLQTIEKLDRNVNRGGEKKLKPEYDALMKIKTVLVDEKKHIRFGDWSAAEIEVLNKYLFLTSKPALYLVNLSEKDYIRRKNKWLPKLKEWIDKNDPGAPLIPFSGVYESKLLDMEPPEREAFIKENVPSALDKIIVQGYKALQLEYFFTAGPDEVKAWTIQKGTKAPQAAGRIHTDFEKGFIMAEVMHFKDFKEEGTEAACKAAGKYRQQGRNYVVEDGDIIFFKFNAGAGLKDAKKK